MSTRDEKEDKQRAALGYHEFPTPGKVSIAPTASQAGRFSHSRKTSS
jgi:hypothetical protein